MLKLLRITALLALFALIPGTALARGGGGDTGGTTDVANANPCATLAGPAGISPESTKANLVLDYKLTSCSAATETVVVSVSGVQTSGNVPTPCTTATVTLPAITLKAGDSRGFKLDSPGQADCRLGAGSYTYTATAADVATGTVLAAVSTTVMKMGGV
ncbi:MAG TPA: hypothetical protein VF549_13120 [Solirubrobacteraceae bacterium]